MADTRCVAELEAAGVLRVEDGNHGEYRPRPHEFVAGGTPYIRAADMSSGTVDFTGAEGINNEALARIRKGIGCEQDTLLSHKGTVGKVAYAPPGSPLFICSPQTTFWRSLDHKKLDPIYLNIALRSRAIQAQLDVMKSSTDMAPYVSLTQQRSIMVNLPPIAEQRAIAEVLGALDDKIAANTHLATTADEWIRSEWERVGDQALDSLPLSSFAESVRDTINPADSNSDEIYVGLEHMPRRQMWLHEHGLATSVTSAKSRFAEGDVLFGKLRPYFHKVVSAPAPGICSTDVLVIRAKALALRGFVLAAASSDAVVASATASSEGTRMPRASWKDVAAVGVPWPGAAEAEQFSARIDTMRAAVNVRLSENLTLAATRDALLPALMSGRLRVRDAEQLASDLT